MSSDATTLTYVPRVRLLRRSARLTILMLVGVMVVVSVFSLLFTEPMNRDFTFPLLALLWLALAYIAVLWWRDGRLPVFEVGTLWVVSTVVYASMPLLSFIAMNGQWSPLADGRLQTYEFDPRVLGSFGWRGALYILGFVIVYLLTRGYRSARSLPLSNVSPALVSSLVLVLAGQYAFKSAVAYFYGLDLDVAYSDIPQAVERAARTPHFVLQVSFIVLASVLLVKEALVLVLIQQWRTLRWRILLMAWLAIEVVAVVVRMGGRGQAVRLLLTFAVLYDRFVRPLRARWLLVGGTLLLSGFLVQGHLRGFLTLGDLTVSNVLTTSNEFQTLFGTAFDIYQRKQLGTLGPVPWQVYVSDLYILIPRQVLPFEKIDPSEWYLGVLGARGTGVGFMFGVMSQAVVGLDWIELAIRGALLGALLGLFHRWYVRHATSFWTTLLYLFVGIWSYYTYRATTFWMVHFVVYQFLPVMVIASSLAYTLSRLPSKVRRAEP